MNGVKLKRIDIESTAQNFCLYSSRWPTYLWSYWVFNAYYSNAGEAGEDVCLIVPAGLSFRDWKVSVGQTDGP